MIHCSLPTPKMCPLVLSLPPPALLIKSIIFRILLLAERQMIHAGKPGMTDKQVVDFISRFMPAYQVYCPNLHKCGKGPAPRKMVCLNMTKNEDEREQKQEQDHKGEEEVCATKLRKCAALLVSIDANRLPVSSYFLWGFVRFIIYILWSSVLNKGVVCWYAYLTRISVRYRWLVVPKKHIVVKGLFLLFLSALLICATVLVFSNVSCVS